ncbi:uncharacterized protein LOC119474100 [Cebus imitator]|uniref:uncharacterized protein LOC119474100 n=1 Tax=Cebus imitator TaxID=2715852 RepID=UPI00189798EE|nr:uncharacterized protein LOC119474100 [Cebus imitator]
MPATTEDSRLSNLWCQKEGATTFYIRKITLGVGVRSEDGDEKVSDIPRAWGFCDSPPGWRQGRGSPDIPRARGLLSFSKLSSARLCSAGLWFLLTPLLRGTPASPKDPTPEGVRLLQKGCCSALPRPRLRPRTLPVRPPLLPGTPPASVSLRKPAATSLMHPFQWCNGCFCGLGLVSTKSCSMPPICFQDLPLNIYMVIFGTGIFVFMLSLIFCYYFISKLRNQAQSERYGYKEVVVKGDAKKLQLYGQTCAVCLEDFKGKDELGVLPCQHAFHRKLPGWSAMA